MRWLVILEDDDHHLGEYAEKVERNLNHRVEWEDGAPVYEFTVVGSEPDLFRATKQEGKKIYVCRDDMNR